VLGQQRHRPLGNGSTLDYSTPFALSGVTGVTSISAGWFGTCIGTGPSASCWGGNGKGELGNGSTTDSNTAVKVLVTP